MFWFESKVRYSEVDCNKQMTLSSILNYFQDCSIFHSEAIGQGITQMEEQKRAWMLSSWQVEVKRYPELGEQIRIYTWAYDFKGFYGYRNFKIEDEAGEVVAYANSIWIYIDIRTGCPCRIPQEIADAYTMEPPFEMEQTGRKVAVMEEMEQKEPFVIRKFHIDTNMHVNNEKYVLMAQEYLRQEQQIGRMRAEYRKQAVLGDLIYPKVKETEQKTVVELADEAGRAYAVIEFQGKENI